MFLRPEMLVFAGAAVVPVVLHMLSRSRQTSVRWGAMMFLTAESPARTHLRRLRRVLLLGLRCMAVLLLTLALARPVTGPATSVPIPAEGGTARTPSPPTRLVPAGVEPMSLVLITDTSGSTGGPTGLGTTRLDAIKEAASRLLSTLQPGEHAALLPSTSAPPSAGDPGPPALTPDLPALSARIAALRSGPDRMDLEALLPRAALALSARTGTTGVIAVVTDRQSITYSTLSPTFVRRWQALRSAAGVSRVLLIPTGPVDRDNVSVNSITIAPVLEPATPLALSDASVPALPGVATRLRITLHNHGTVPRAAHPVTVWVEGIASEFRSTVDLPPDSDGTCDVTVTFPRPGRFVVTAMARGGGPAFDDTLQEVIVVSEPVAVLAVVAPEARPNETRPDAGPGPASRPGGTPGTLPRISPAALALAPFGDGPDSLETTDPRNAANVTFVPPQRLPVYSLDRYRVVLIPHLTRCTEAEALALTQFVQGGGGLVVGIGPNTPEGAIRRLAHLLPARVGPASVADGPSRGVMPADPSPITAHAVGMPEVLPGATVWRYRRLKPPSDDSTVREVATVLRLSGPEGPDVQEKGADASIPLLVQGRFGAGAVVLSAAPLDGPWSDLSASPGYVPLMQAMVRFAAGGEPYPASVRLGEAVTVTLPDDADPRSVWLECADGSRVSPRLQRRSTRPTDRLTATWGPTKTPGLHTFRYRVGVTIRAEPVAVRRDLRESDLTASDESVRRAAALLGAEVIPDTPAGLDAVRHGAELWPVALGAATLCLLAELLLSRAARAGTNNASLSGQSVGAWQGASDRRRGASREVGTPIG